MITRVDEDKLILTDGKNCKRFKQVEHSVSNSQEWQTMFNEKMPNEYLNENLYDWLREETGFYDYDLLLMSDVGTYVNIAKWHGMELSFPVSDEHNKWC